MNHALLATRIAGILRPRLRGRGCEPFGSDLRVALTFRSYAYPDATVICGKPEAAAKDPNTIVDPTVVLEVISPTTEPYDRVSKHVARALPTLTTRVLVSSEEGRSKSMSVARTARDYEGLDSSVSLPAIGAETPLAELYEGVEFAS